MKHAVHAVGGIVVMRIVIETVKPQQLHTLTIDLTQHLHRRAPVVSRATKIDDQHHTTNLQLGHLPRLLPPVLNPGRCHDTK